MQNNRQLLRSITVDVNNKSDGLLRFQIHHEVSGIENMDFGPQLLSVGPRYAKTRPQPCLAVFLSGQECRSAANEAFIHRMICGEYCGRGEYLL
jgi:hypothetical protein